MSITLHINSGWCKCGCRWDDHHLGLIMNSDVIVAIVEYIRGHRPDFQVDERCNGYPLYVPQECERYGSNELGGRKHNEETGEYEDHCHQYEDRDGPLAVIE